MKRTLLVLAAVLMLGIGVSPALAWEFSVKAESEIRYRYISRTGPNDLFGNVEVAQQNPGVQKTSIGLSGPNNGYVQVEGFSCKGSDAAYAEQRFWLYPKVQVHEGISLYAILSFSGNLNGTYKPLALPNTDLTPFTNQQNIYVGPSENWATNPHYAGWVMLNSRDIARGVAMFAPVGHAFWTRLKLPWGTLIFGRRPAGFGMGWVVHEEDNYTTSLSLVVPYGPLSFVFSQYFNDNGEYSDPNDYANRFADYPGLISQYFSWQYTPASAVDKNESMDWNQAAAVVYRSGGIDMGAMARVLRWSNVHAASYVNLGTPGLRLPYGSRRNDTVLPPFATQVPPFLVEPLSGLLGTYAAYQPDPQLLIPMTGDLFFLLGSVYFKHAQDRVFLNAEYDFQFIEVRRKGGRPVSGFPQAWAAEVGFLAGPLKLSLAHFYRSGHDRRYGHLWPSSALGTSSFAPNPLAHDRWDFFLTAWGGGQAPIEPYNFLIGLYGTGNNSFSTAGTCTYKDFLAYAARLDYALAANLNLFASFMHAERASNTGTWQGLYGGDFFNERGAGEFPYSGFPSPNVPDNLLGWEVDLGFHWKLMENLTWKLLLARWQPGNWFKWAYRDHSASSTTFGIVNPGRTIDPLIAVQTSVLVDF